MRGARGTPFTDQGSYANIVDAAAAIAKMENEPPLWVFLRVPVDLYKEPTDAEVLSHLEYQSATRFYELTRSQN